MFLLTAIVLKHFHLYPNIYPGYFYVKSKEILFYVPLFFKPGKKRKNIKNKMTSKKTSYGSSPNLFKKTFIFFCLIVLNYPSKTSTVGEVYKSNEKQINNLKNCYINEIDSRGPLNILFQW